MDVPQGRTLALSVFADRRTKLLIQRYKIFRVLADALKAQPRLYSSLHKPDSIDTNILENVGKTMLSTVSVEHALEVSLKRYFWKPICNTAAESIDKPDRIQRLQARRKQIDYWLDTCRTVIVCSNTHTVTLHCICGRRSSATTSVEAAAADK